jgi:hypothetical protein
MGFLSKSLPNTTLIPLNYNAVLRDMIRSWAIRMLKSLDPRRRLVPLFNTVSRRAIKRCLQVVLLSCNFFNSTEFDWNSAEICSTVWIHGSTTDARH